MSISNEREARKFIDNIFDRIETYECAQAIDSLPKVDDLINRFPALERQYRGIYNIYIREQKL